MDVKWENAILHLCTWKVMDVEWENAILHPCTWKVMDVKWENASRRLDMEYNSTWMSNEEETCHQDGPLKACYESFGGG